MTRPDLPTIQHFPEHLVDAEKQFLDGNYLTHLPNHPSNIVIAAMGGSALAGHIAGSLTYRRIRVPLHVVSEYHLPGSTTAGSLVIPISYSGNTEETLSCVKDAHKIRADRFLITTGGELAEEVTEHKKGMILTTERNLTKQPRYGLGYLLAPIQLILERYSVGTTTPLHTRLTPLRTEGAWKQVEKQAHALASACEHRQVLIIAAEHLTGTAHALQNLFHETAKTYAACFPLSELNHHLLEGLSHPNLRESTTALFINSPLYSETVNKRLRLTQHIFEKANIPCAQVHLTTADPFAQAVETLWTGYALTGELAEHYGENPIETPTVQYFKRKLAE